MTKEQRKRLEMLCIRSGAVIVGIFIMWYIFRPTDKKETNEGKNQFNTTVPTAVVDKIDNNKQNHYKNEVKKDEHSEREKLKELAEVVMQEQKPTIVATKPPPPKTPTEKVMASTKAYSDINKTLANFYEEPPKPTKEERLQSELDSLKEQMSQKRTQPVMGVDEQVALLEKSYQLAAKYMPKEVTEQIPPPKVEAKPHRHSEKVTATKNSVVSSLSSSVNDAGFITAVGVAASKSKNTISAVIHTNQTITDGGAVRLRLTEPTQIGDYSLPRNAIVTGYGKVQGERLYIAISSIEHSGNIKEVDLTVIDGDGQEGIFIPNSMEVSAVKEVAANLGGNMSTTINLNQQSAGNQILTDLGKGAIEGASQYVSKKLRLQKVYLKAGYKIMLYHKKQ